MEIKCICGKLFKCEPHGKCWCKQLNKKSLQKLCHAKILNKKNNIKKYCKSNKIDFISINTSENYLNPLEKFFNHRIQRN